MSQKESKHQEVTENFTGRSGYSGSVESAGFKQTIGQYRVGVSFNPSQNPLVDQIKQKAAELIDLIDLIRVESEVSRLVNHAQTLIEDAAMNAVKAATKQPRE